MAYNALDNYRVLGMLLGCYNPLAGGEDLDIPITSLESCYRGHLRTFIRPDLNIPTQENDDSVGVVRQPHCPRWSMTFDGHFQAKPLWADIRLIGSIPLHIYFNSRQKKNSA